MIQRPQTNSGWKPDIKRAKGYRGRIIGISPPYPDRGLKDCKECTGGKIAVNNQVVNCPSCEGTGKQMEQKILLTYTIDRQDKQGNPQTQLTERVKDSLFAGGAINGTQLRPSTWYKRLVVLYGLEPGTEIEAGDMDPYDDLSSGSLPELVLLVYGYKVFDVRLYEGENDRIHAQTPPSVRRSPVAASNPPVQPISPTKPKLKPAGSVGPGNGLPLVTVQNTVTGVPPTTRADSTWVQPLSVGPVEEYDAEAEAEGPIPF
jgi:hypothetical protein